MNINANNIITEFSQANMNAIIQAYPLGDLRYREHFPLLYNPFLTYSNIEGADGAKIMADIVAIGSKAPRKGREFVENIKGEIPKVEIARDLNEKDLLTIQQLRYAVNANPTNAGIKNQLVDKIYEDPLFCIDGINARMEWMAKQLVSTGKYKTTATNNDGVVNVSVDFKVKTQNALKKWADADANPIEEIEKYQEEAKGKGYSYATITMSRATLNQVLKNKNTRAFVLGIPINATTILPDVRLDQLNAELAERGLPIIKVWESFISFEGKDGEVIVANGWEEGNILFSTSALLGSTQYTTTTEFTMDFADVMSKSIKDSFILVNTFGHQDPISVSTKATAFATPVLNDSKRKLIIKTKF
uniref:Capsid protein n=1 Tax=Siphoviridae sp. ctvod4 TaxID=2827595 RepID=A0A8S5LKW3_9CAUD|nr:MAG TPA: capsid protein [Siphoviridae sp. ctvod4]